jgi:hypothetical protein
MTTDKSLENFIEENLKLTDTSGEVPIANSSLQTDDSLA